MSFNSDELNAPHWINGDFLKTVLEFNGDNSGVLILNYEITPGSGKNDHFASIMFRARLTYTTKTYEHKKCSVIIKTLPVVEGIKKEMLSENQIDIFKAETFMYTEVLNRCSNILHMANFCEKLAPKILYYSDLPQKIIVLEDLNELGYFMFPRSIIGRTEAELIFSKLGQYHAAVYKMEKEGRGDLTKIVGSIFHTNNIDHAPLFKKGLQFLHKMVLTLPNFESIADKLGNISHTKLLEKCKKSLSKPSGYNLLNHGDYHIKNMMFSGATVNDISGMALIDFQLCHWGSPAYDLYFVISCLPFETREHYYRLYFETFVAVLMGSGFKGHYPSYEEFQNELKSYQHLDLQMLWTIAVHLRADTNTDEDIEIAKLIENPDLLEILFKSSTYVTYAKTALTALATAGVLDDPEIMKSDGMEN